MLLTFLIRVNEAMQNKIYFLILLEILFVNSSKLFKAKLCFFCRIKLKKRKK